MARRSKAVGSGELLRFYLDPDRFAAVDAHGIAVIAALLVHVRTSGKGRAQYHARPSQQLLMRISRTTRPTVAKWLRYYENSGFLRVTRRRAGRRNGVNDYDVRPAVQAILEERAARQADRGFDATLVPNRDRLPELRVIQGGGGSA